MNRRIVKLTYFGLVVSLLALWIFSYWSTLDPIEITTGGSSITVTCRDGRIDLSQFKVKSKMPPATKFRPRTTSEIAQATMSHSHVLRWRVGARISVLMLVALTLGVLLWIRPVVIAMRRRARGVCPKCGYDLRGVMNRCPECGTPIGFLRH